MKADFFAADRTNSQNIEQWQKRPSPRPNTLADLRVQHFFSAPFSLIKFTAVLTDQSHT